MKTIEPKLLSGFKDMLPGEAMVFEGITEKIKVIYKSFGFVPLETACMERRDVLTGGAEDFNKSIFLARIVKGVEDRNANWQEEDSAMRFDLTVPLARVVAAHRNELPWPFKRYQIGKVWRGESAQAGRFREFYQFDFDTVGANSILADIETIQIMYGVMSGLIESGKFTIRFNTRKILNCLAESVGCGEKSKEMFRIIDKLDKIGIEGVLEELRREPDSEWDENALAMSAENAERIKEFLEIKGETSGVILDKLRDCFGEEENSGQEGIRELAEISAALLSLGIPQRNVRIDLSVARGLDYYTGPVFETTLDEMPELGSVFSGGRFDGLINRFVPGSNIPAVGASVGLDRLIVGMLKLGLIEKKNSLTEVLVTVFDENNRQNSLNVADFLRSRGFKVEIYLGEDCTLRAQFAYAAKKSIPFVVIIGPDEAAKGIIQLKDMNAKKQESLTLEEAVDKLKAVLR